MRTVLQILLGSFATFLTAQYKGILETETESNIQDWKYTLDRSPELQLLAMPLATSQEARATPPQCSRKRAQQFKNDKSLYNTKKRIKRILFSGAKTWLTDVATKTNNN